MQFKLFKKQKMYMFKAWSKVLLGEIPYHHIDIFQKHIGLPGFWILDSVPVFYLLLKKKIFHASANNNC